MSHLVRIASRIRRRLFRICAGTAGFLLSATLGAALEEVPCVVAPQPWGDDLGNHRAVVHVGESAGAVRVEIPWRRRDHDPERKHIIVVDAATGRAVTNVARLSNDRFVGTLAFQPQTVPGDYFVYYLPFPEQKSWGGYGGDYFKPKDTADPAWKARVAGSSADLPRARMLRLAGTMQLNTHN